MDWTSAYAGEFIALPLINPLTPLSQNPSHPLREKIALSSQNNKNLFMPQVTQIHRKPFLFTIKRSITML
jgi:hypothetical protein